MPLMCELVECLDLKLILKKHKVEYNQNDFESLYDDLVSSGNFPELVKEIENRVRTYFSDLYLPAEATIYDYLVLSLREKDLIASFNWDPFLIKAWQRNSRAVKLPEIVFLHGNVEIAICSNHRWWDIRGSVCKECKKPLTAIPLLYPVKQKNYNAHPFIKGEWIKIKDNLNCAYFLTIFGYAAPKTDIEARKLLLEAWKENPTYNFAQMDIIDIKPEEELSETWEEFFCRDHYGILESIWDSYLFNHPRRSCEAFAMATLQGIPWESNPFPQTENLKRLQDYARLFWFEEKKGKLSGESFEFS